MESKLIYFLQNNATAVNQVLFMLLLGQGAILASGWLSPKWLLRLAIKLIARARAIEASKEAFERTEAEMLKSLVPAEELERSVSPVSTEVGID